MSIRTPAREHELNHNRPDVEMGDCWQCQRGRVRCRAKRRYPDGQTAAEAAMEVNINQGWAWMLAPYGCPWCCSFHLTKAKPGSARWKRTERRRRKWVTAQQGTSQREMVPSD